MVEKKSTTLQEMIKTMLNDHDVPKYFFKAVNTACYVLNRVLIRPTLNKTPYELWNYKIGYFKSLWMQMFYFKYQGKFEKI